MVGSSMDVAILKDGLVERGSPGPGNTSIVGFLFGELLLPIQDRENTDYRFAPH